MIFINPRIRAMAGANVGPTLVAAPSIKAQGVTSMYSQYGLCSARRGTSKGV